MKKVYINSDSSLLPIIQDLEKHFPLSSFSLFSLSWFGNFRKKKNDVYVVKSFTRETLRSTILWKGSKQQAIEKAEP